MDFSNVEVQEDNIEAEGELSGLTNSESPKALPAIWSEVSTRLFMISHSLNQFDFRNYKHFVSSGDALSNESSQANDFGIVKTRSKKEHNHSCQSLRRMPLVTRAC